MTDWKDALSALTGVERKEENTANAEISRKKRVGVVYSTNPDYEYEDEKTDEATTLPKNQQKLRLNMERAGRGGKTVTIVRGFKGTEADLKALCKLLKQKCGVGGTVTYANGEKAEGEIVIQGDLRQRLIDMLKQEGYTQTK